MTEEAATSGQRGGDAGGALLARVRGGDAAAFAELMGLHSGLVRGVAVRTLGPQEAQDACQDVWLRVWLSVDKFRGDSSFSTWLYRVALNTCLAEYRRVSRRQASESPGGQQWPWATYLAADDGRGDPARALADKERRDEARLRVLLALSSVREEHRNAFVLRHAGGLSYQEVAEALGVPGGTAKGWVHRGKATARAAVAGPGMPGRSQSSGPG